MRAFVLNIVHFLPAIIGWELGKWMTGKLDKFMARRSVKFKIRLAIAACILAVFALLLVYKADGAQPSATPSPTAVVTPGFAEHLKEFPLPGGKTWTKCRLQDLDGVKPAGMLRLVVEALEPGFRAKVTSTGNGFEAIKAGDKRYFSLIALDDSIQWRGLGKLTVIWKTRLP